MQIYKSKKLKLQPPCLTVGMIHFLLNPSFTPDITEYKSFKTVQLVPFHPIDLFKSHTLRP